MKTGLFQKNEIFYPSRQDVPLFSRFPYGPHTRFKIAKCKVSITSDMLHLLKRSGSEGRRMEHRITAKH